MVPEGPCELGKREQDTDHEVSSDKLMPAQALLVSFSLEMALPHYFACDDMHTVGLPRPVMFICEDEEINTCWGLLTTRLGHSQVRRALNLSPVRWRSFIKS